MPHKKKKKKIAICCTAIKPPVPDWVEPSFVIFDIGAF